MNTNNTLDLTPHFALDGDQPFKDRRAMMPFRGAIPVAKEQLVQTWQEMINQTVSPRKRLVYLHIPFCATHCTFCGFYQNRFNEDVCAHYTDALIREIELKQTAYCISRAPSTRSISVAVRLPRFQHTIWPESSPHYEKSCHWPLIVKSLSKAGY